MKELPLNELLYQLDQAQRSMMKTVTLLHDTGDYESEALDEATTQAERVVRLIDIAYSEFHNHVHG